MPVSTKTRSTSLKTLLGELVAMRTVTADKAANKAALAWFGHQVAGLPLHATEFTRDGYAAMVLTTRKTKHPKLLLHAHVDVVPGPDSSFELKEHAGRYLGRGVFDMKLAAATYLKLLLDLGGTLPDYDLGVMLTTEEEVTGGELGVAPLVAAGWGADLVVNPDSVYGTSPGWQIQRAAKGTVKFRLRSTGQAGHGARTWEYRSAIFELIAALTELARHFPSEPCGDPEHAHHTINIGRIEGGQAANQVADSAAADIDLRFMPGTTADDIQQTVTVVLAGFPHTHIERKYGDDQPVSIEPGHPAVKRLRGLIEEVTGADPKLVLSHGASESSFFAAAGMPVLMFSPPGGGHHSDAEWIDAQALNQFYEIIRRLTEDVAL